MFINRFIKDPVWGNDAFAALNVKPYLKNVESMLIDAGLVKSDVVDNLDTDNITLPSISLATSPSTNNIFYIDKPLQFDMNDIGQSTLPIRLKFYMGFFRYANTKNGTSEYPVFVVSKLEVVNITTGTIIFTSYSNYIESYTTYIASSFEYFIPNSYTINAKSSVIYRDGFLAINITPDWYEYGTSFMDRAASMFTIIIERYDGNINIIAPITNQMSAAGFGNYVYGVVTPLSRSESMCHYVDTGGIYSDGKLPIFPYFISNGNEIKQSSNIAFVNSKSMATSTKIKVTDNNANEIDFIAFSGKGGYHMKTSGRIIVRV